MRFTDTQVYYLRQLTKGPVPLAVWRKWDQRPLRGLFIRGLFRIAGNYDASATRDGWRAFQGTLSPKYRKHPENPPFKRAQSERIRVAR